MINDQTLYALLAHNSIERCSLKSHEEFEARVETTKKLLSKQCICYSKNDNKKDDSRLTASCTKCMAT